MGVRFDKLTTASQPVLEKILAEKARREQAGAPSKTGPAGGMAVRRPSSTFSAPDPAAARARRRRRAAPPARREGCLRSARSLARPLPAGHGLEPPPLSARAASRDRARRRLGPRSARCSRTTAPAVSSDPFGTRTGARPPLARRARVRRRFPAASRRSRARGAFGRPRSTTGMNAQRPAPAPSALFEKADGRRHRSRALGAHGGRRSRAGARCGSQRLLVTCQAAHRRAADGARVDAGRRRRAPAALGHAAPLLRNRAR